MKNVFLETGQRFFQDVLDWFQTGKEESDTDRRNDFSDKGILGDASDEFDIVIGDNDNPPTTHSINVKSGVAYDNNGERIVITDPIASYDPSAPGATSTDGKGGTVSTPLSTGSKNITLTANVVNYIWIDYLAIRDTSEFTLHRITNRKQYFKQDNGFQITVTTIDTPPTSASLKLGNVDLTGGGVVSAGTIDKTGRLESGIKLKRTKIKVGKFDRSDATTSYNHEDEVFLDFHIKALGTGVLSNNNPHALAPLDIGLNTAEILETHQKFLHSTGIVGDPLSTTTSLYLEHVPVGPGDDFVRIKPLDTDEVAEIDGIIISNSDIPSEVTLLFSSVTDATNTYYVFINKNTKVVQRSTTNPAGDDAKLALWSFLWTADAGGPGDGDITNIVDLRVFGNIATREIQDGSVTSEKLGNRITLPDGTLLEPTYSFITEDSGLYLAGVNDLRLAINNTDRLITNSSEVSLSIDTNNKFRLTSTNATITFGGSDRLDIDTSKITANLSIKGIAGTLANPTYSFTADPDSGWFLSLVGQVDLSVNSNTVIHNTQSLTEFSYLGTLVGRFNNTGLHFLNSTKVFVAPVTSPSTPPYSFEGDEDTGIFHPESNGLGLSIGGNEVLKTTSTETTLSLNGNDILAAVTATTTLSLNGTSFLTANSDEVLIKTGFRLQTTDTGTNSDPIIQRNADPDTGLYWATDEVKFTTGGTNRFTVNNSGIQVNSGTLLLPFGSVATPAVRFSGNGSLSESTGIYYRQQASGAGSSRIEFSIEGTKKIELTADSLIANTLNVSVGSLDLPGQGSWNSTRLEIEAGSDGIPSLTFGIDLDTGIFRPAVDSIALTTGGTSRLVIRTDNTLELNTGLKKIPHTLTTGVPVTISTSDVRDHTFIRLIITAASLQITLPTGLGAGDIGQEVTVISDISSTNNCSVGPTGVEKIFAPGDFSKWIWTGSSYAKSI